MSWLTASAAAIGSLAIFGWCACSLLSPKNLVVGIPREQTFFGIIGQGNVLGSFQVIGVSPGGGNTTVKFKLASITGNSDNLLVVSPSSGTTPATVYVSLNHSVAATEAVDGTRGFGLNFVTTDQTPVSQSPNETDPKVAVTMTTPETRIIRWRQSPRSYS